MPVHKFRSITEMKQDRWRLPGDPELARALQSLWELAARTRKNPLKPGVYKHKNIEAAKALKDEWNGRLKSPT